MSPSYQVVARIISIMTTILSAAMVFEYAWFLRYEYRLIWPSLGKSPEAKVFVVTRYIGLAGQIFNLWFATKMASGVSFPPRVCLAWLWYQATSIQILLVSVQYLLMRRVYKLYNKDKVILSILYVFAGAQTAAMAASARSTVPSTISSPTCVVTVESHPSKIYLGTLTISVYLALVGMMIWRYFKIKCSDSVRAWLRIAVRDSICAVVAVSLSLLLMMFTNKLGNFDPPLSENIVFYVLFSSLWFAAGRIVLDQEILSVKPLSEKGLGHEVGQWTDTLELNPDDLGVLETSGVSATMPSDPEVAIEFSKKGPAQEMDQWTETLELDPDDLGILETSGVSATMSSDLEVDIQFSKKGPAQEMDQWTETLELDPDDLRPLEPPDEVSPAIPSDPEVVLARLSNASAIELEVGTQDIVEQPIYG